MHDPLAHALVRVGELVDSPAGLLGRRASILALYDALMAATTELDGEVATSRPALSFAVSATMAFGLAAKVAEAPRTADTDREMLRLLKRGHDYLQAAVDAERLARDT